MEAFSINDNSSKTFREIGFSEKNVEDLSLIANRALKDLHREDGLISFPLKSLDEVEEMPVFEIREDKIFTGNAMGFIGVGTTLLNIRSRFCRGNAQDWFLFYMLAKVFMPAVLKLEQLASRELTELDFLIFMFPKFLLAAREQGIFKTYVRNHYEDERMKGAVNIARHLRLHIPFDGKISYDLREHSFDNAATQLVRHTIEFIKRTNFGEKLLFENYEVRETVREIFAVTPTYSRRDLQKVLSKNAIPLTHPYFTAWRDLQKLCLAILQRDNRVPAGKNDKIFGVVFDGAWLWEEFLWTVLREQDFKHPRNKNKSGAICPFEDSGVGRFFPDFYRKNEIVLDAKYKGFDEKNPGADDLRQVIAYMHVLSARTGVFVYPSKFDSGILSIGNLKGDGGKVLKCRIKIPQDAASFGEFCSRMSESLSALDFFNAGIPSHAGFAGFCSPSL